MSNLYSAFFPLHFIADFTCDTCQPIIIMQSDNCLLGQILHIASGCHEYGLLQYLHAL